MSANWSIDWNAKLNTTSGAALGKVVTTDGTQYIVATSANYALYPSIRAVVVTAPNAQGICAIQFNGDVAASITGLSTSSGVGYGVLAADGSITFKTAAAIVVSDIVIGSVINGLLNIAFTTGAALIGEQIISLRTYGGVPGGVVDSTDALRQAIAALAVGGTILVDGFYLLTDTVYVDNTTAAGNKRSITFEGTDSSPNNSLLTTGFYFAKAKRYGAVASMEKVAMGVAHAPLVPVFEYIKVSGCTGAAFTSADLGKQFRTSGAAYTAWNIIGVIVQVNSATEVVIAAKDQPYTALKAIGGTDANNGAIGWTVLEQAIVCRSREIAFKNISFKCYDAASYAWSYIAFTESPDYGGAAGAGNCTALNLENVQFWTNALYNVEKGVQIGQDIIPIAPHPYVYTESGYTRPHTPFQCDYLYARQIRGDYLLGGVTYSHNITGQERANRIYSIDAVLCGHVIEVGSVHQDYNADNASPGLYYLSSIGSFAYEIIGMSFGGISQSVIKHGATNDSSSVTQFYGEGTVKRLFDCRIGGASASPFLWKKGLCSVSSVAADGVFAWLPIGDTAFEQVSFLPSGGALTNFCVKTTAAGYALASFRDCEFPSESSTGIAFFQQAAALASVFTEQNCYYSSGGNVVCRPDRSWVQGTPLGHVGDWREFDVTTYGAKGDASTDCTAAFVAAIAAKDAAGGGIIRVPTGRYKITAQVSLGTKPVIFQGDGWASANTSTFGNASWSAGDPTYTFGSIIYTTSTSADLFKQSSNDKTGYIFRDLVIIGPGSGTTTGIKSTATSGVSRMYIHGCLVANFYCGIDPGPFENSGISHSDIRGCTTGLLFDDPSASGIAPTDWHIYDLKCEANTIAIDFRAGFSLWVYGGLMQANLTGMRFKSTSASRIITECYIDGVYFEANTTANIDMDASLHSVARIHINNCRIADSNPWLMTQGVGGLAQIYIDGNYAAGTTLTIPSATTNSFVGPKNVFATMTNAAPASQNNLFYYTGSMTSNVVQVPKAEWYTDGTAGNAANGAYIVGLPHGATKFIQWAYKAPADGVVCFVVQYYMAAASGNAIRLQFSYKAIGITEDPTAALTAGAAFTVTPGNNANLHEITEANSTTLRVAVTLGDIVLLKLSRIGGDAADTHLSDMNVMQIMGVFA